MDWELNFASDWSKRETMRIETIHDLEALYHKYDKRLIVDFRNRLVIIYDDYVE